MSVNYVLSVLWFWRLHILYLKSAQSKWQLDYELLLIWKFLIWKYKTFIYIIFFYNLFNKIYFFRNMGMGIRVHRLPLNLSDFNLLFFGGVVWYKNGKYEVSAHSIKVKVCLVGFNCQFFLYFFTFLAPFSDFLTFLKLLFFC